MSVGSRKIIFLFVLCTLVGFAWPASARVNEGPRLDSRRAALQYLIRAFPGATWMPNGIPILMSGAKRATVVPYNRLEVTVNHYFPFGIGPEQLFVGTSGLFGTGVRLYSGSYDKNKQLWNRAIIALKTLGVRAATPSGSDIDIRGIRPPVIRSVAGPVALPKTASHKSRTAEQTRLAQADGHGVDLDQKSVERIKKAILEWNVDCRDENSMPTSLCSGRAPCWLYAVQAHTKVRAIDADIFGTPSRLREFMDFIAKGSRTYCEKQLRLGKVRSPIPSINSVASMVTFPDTVWFAFSSFQTRNGAPWVVQENGIGKHWRKLQVAKRQLQAAQAISQTCTHDFKNPDIMCVRLGMTPEQIPPAIGAPLVPSTEHNGTYQMTKCFPSGGDVNTTTCLRIYFTGMSFERVVYQVSLSNLFLGRLRYGENATALLVKKFGPYSSSKKNMVGGHLMLAWHTGPEFFAKVAGRLPFTPLSFSMDWKIAAGFPNYNGLKTISKVVIADESGTWTPNGNEYYAGVTLLDVQRELANYRAFVGKQAAKRSNARRLELKEQGPPKF